MKIWVRLEPRPHSSIHLWNVLPWPCWSSNYQNYTQLHIRDWSGRSRKAFPGISGRCPICVISDIETPCGRICILRRTNLEIGVGDVLGDFQVAHLPGNSMFWKGKIRVGCLSIVSGQKSRISVFEPKSCCSIKAERRNLLFGILSFRCLDIPEGHWCPPFRENMKTKHRKALEHIELITSVRSLIFTNRLIRRLSEQQNLWRTMIWTV